MRKKTITKSIGTTNKVNLSYNELMQMTNNDIDDDIKERIDKEEEENLTIQMTPDAIPDINNMLNIVNEMLEFMESSHMKKMQENDKKQFEAIVCQKYNTLLPLSMINNLLEPEPDRSNNLSILMDMFDRLDAIKKGQRNIHTEHDIFHEGLRKQYVYPTFGGKEKYEQEIAKRTNKK
jgi:hypothetical protein